MHKNESRNFLPAVSASILGSVRWWFYSAGAQYPPPCAASEERHVSPKARCGARPACRESPDGNIPAAAGGACECRVRRGRFGSVHHLIAPAEKTRGSVSGYD